MKKALLILLISLSFSSFSKEYNLNLTFIDGYTNEAIANEKVTLRIINLDWSEEFVTDDNGSINVNFEAEHFIKYNFRFDSYKYSTQMRERYLREASKIELTFEIYPTWKYEKEISKKEAAILDQLTEEPDSLNCLEPALDVMNVLTENYVDEHMQLPYWYGDYGFKVEFKIQAVIDPNGNLLQVEIIESSDHHLNEEIVRLVRQISGSNENPCGNQFKKTIQFPIVIDHDNMMWDE